MCPQGLRQHAAANQQMQQAGGQLGAGNGFGQDPLGANAEDRKVSTSDIQLVQNLIERCMQLYMSQVQFPCLLFVQSPENPSSFTASIELGAGTYGNQNAVNSHSITSDIMQTMMGGLPLSHPSSCKCILRACQLSQAPVPPCLLPDHMEQGMSWACGAGYYYG